MKKDKQKTIKLISIIAFALFLVVSIVINLNGQFLYPEYNASIWRTLLSAAYLASFCFLVYNYSHSKTLFIVYTVCIGLLIICSTLLTVFAGRIPDLLATIIGIIQVVFFGVFIVVPLGSALWYLNINAAVAYIVIILLFYAVYFTSRLIKKRKGKDDENVKIENG